MARRRQLRQGPNPPAIQLRRTLKTLGLRPKKSLGQHFLVDTQVLGHILEAADLSPSDVVIEVGPGLGVLTKEIAKKVHQVIAVELDDGLTEFLQQSLGSFPNIKIVHSDILQSDPAILLSPLGVFPPTYKVIADLPYYITSPVLRHFLEASAKPSRMVLMVQKEVGLAIAADRGNTSLLAVSVQFYGKPTVVKHVSSRSFHPQPKVDSVILRIDLYEKPAVDVPSPDEFFRVVRAGFSARRKQLRNALAQGLQISPPDALVLLDEAGIDRQRRAESLSLTEWASLCHAVTRRQTELHQQYGG